MTTREMMFASALVALAAMTGCNSGGTTDTDAGPPMLTCASYCNTITMNCSDANRQYGDAADEAMSNCMSSCAHMGWAMGTLADTSGNTLGCHLYHAGAAGGSAANATLHCPHAGPLGSGVCGDSNCANFCAADTAVCGTMAYATPAACMTACTGYSDATTASTSPTATAGNTLACRAYHLSAASSGVAADVTTHCPHTGMTSATCM